MVPCSVDTRKQWKDMGASNNRGKTPKWMVKIMENPIKMDEFGVPYFWKHPYGNWHFDAFRRESSDSPDSPDSPSHSSLNLEETHGRFSRWRVQKHVVHHPFYLNRS